MIDLATAFGVFANAGIKQAPVTILEVKDWKGNILEKTEIKDGDRVIPQGVAYLISHILVDNNARTAAFGPSSYLLINSHPEVSVKTGTTNDKRDNWTIGYNPEVVVAVWVGNNDNTPMSAVASGVTGASPIWNRIIKKALERIENGELVGFGENAKKHQHVWPQKPADVVGTNVCATSGTLPAGSEDNPECSIRFEFFLEDSLPLPPGSPTKAVLVTKDTGMLAPPDAPLDLVEPREKTVVTDPLGTDVCLDCPPQDWQVKIEVGSLNQE